MIQPLKINNNFNNINPNDRQYTNETKSAYQSDNEDIVENERFKRLTKMRIKLKRDKEAAEKLKENDKIVKENKKNFKFRY